MLRSLVLWTPFRQIWTDQNGASYLAQFGWNGVHWILWDRFLNQLMIWSWKCYCVCLIIKVMSSYYTQFNEFVNVMYIWHQHVSISSGLSDIISNVFINCNHQVRASYVLGNLKISTCFQFHYFPVKSLKILWQCMVMLFPGLHISQRRLDPKVLFAPSTMLKWFLSAGQVMKSPYVVDVILYFKSIW